jgi:hypothetical protein
VKELSSIPLKREEKMGQVHITVGTGLVYSHSTDDLIVGVSKIIGANADPSEIELRKAVAETLQRDEYSLNDKDIWATLVRELDRRKNSAGTE